MMQQLSSRLGRRAQIAAVCVLIALPAGLVTARQLTPAATSPATGHAQVITQGITRLPSGKLVWRVVERTAQPRWQAKANNRPLGFILASDEPVLLSNVTSSGNVHDVARLGTGEAYLVEDGTNQIRASMSDQPVTYLALELVAEGDAEKVGGGKLLFKSDALTPPAGERDVDLVRNVLKMNETATLPDTGQPVYILATDGAIDIEPASGKRTTLESGESGIFSGELTIKAVSPTADVNGQSAAARLMPSSLQTGDSGAGYVVAVIGDEIPPVQTPTPTPTVTPTPSETPTATEIPTDVPTVEILTEAPTDVPRPTRTPTEEPTATDTPTEEPTATETPNPDLDGDGLSNVDEKEFGTDPNNPDTDGDGLSDGDEVHKYNSDPTIADSDQDGLTDGQEVNTYGTDPTNRDTDGDRYSDGREVAAGTDPLNPADPPRISG
jgi:hypothetical protein